MSNFNEQGNQNNEKMIQSLSLIFVSVILAYLFIKIVFL
jgi:hypothetical protein